MARQFDVCPVTGLEAGSAVAFAVVLQADDLADMSTRVVAPLIPMDLRRRTDRLAPEVTVQRSRYMVAVHLMTTLPTRTLGEPIASLRLEESASKSALDLLFFGV